MHVNHQLIVSGVLLMAAGYYRAFFMRTGTGKPTVTRIVVGGYLALIIASVADMLFPLAGWLAGLILMGALTTSAFVIIPDLVGRIQKGPQSPAVH